VKDYCLCLCVQKIQWVSWESYSTRRYTCSAWTITYDIIIPMCITEHYFLLNTSQLSNMWPDLGKPEKTPLKILTISFKLFFAHLYKAIILLAVKVYTRSFFFLGDMDNYIRPTQFAKKVGFPRSGHTSDTMHIR